MSQSPITPQRIRHLPPMLRMVFLVLALLTLLMPFDLLPDLAPLAGWLDDTAAFGYLAFELIQSIRAWRARKNS